MAKREKSLAALCELGIAFELEEHPAVFTMDEMHALGITGRGTVCKNLFLRDAKGRNHYLVVIAGDKRADLAAIANQLGSGKLGFASEARLMEHLGLEKGEVTPLGIVNNENRSVILVFDEELKNKGRLGVHPCDNTATVWLGPGDLIMLAERFGAETRYVRI